MVLLRTLLATALPLYCSLCVREDRLQLHLKLGQSYIPSYCVTELFITACFSFFAKKQVTWTESGNNSIPTCASAYIHSLRALTANANNMLVLSCTKSIAFLLFSTTHKKTLVITSNSSLMQKQITDSQIKYLLTAITSPKMQAAS